MVERQADAKPVAPPVLEQRAVVLERGVVRLPLARLRTRPLDAESDRVHAESAQQRMVLGIAVPVVAGAPAAAAVVHLAELLPGPPVAVDVVALDLVAGRSGPPPEVLREGGRILGCGIGSSSAGAPRMTEAGDACSGPWYTRASIHSPDPPRDPQALADPDPPALPRREKCALRTCSDGAGSGGDLAWPRCPSARVFPRSPPDSSFGAGLPSGALRPAVPSRRNRQWRQAIARRRKSVGASCLRNRPGRCGPARAAAASSPSSRADASA